MEQLIIWVKLFVTRLLEFMNQILEKRIFVDEERIYNTFKMFDLNNKGKISKENLW
jgi:Ca2+-binding EF-hand superfamily protein